MPFHGKRRDIKVLRFGVFSFADFCSTHSQMARTYAALRNPWQYTGSNLTFKANVLGV